MNHRMRASMLGGTIALLLLTTAQAEDASAVFARSKAASGGAHWDTVHSLHSSGKLSAGGLQGAFQQIEDVQTGRASDSYRIGPVDGADGYDGAHAWSRSPGGEVAVLDDPDAVRNARSSAWLAAMGYWYPQRGHATYGAVTVLKIDGKRFDVITATPDGGNPVTLWFAADTGLLARSVQKMGGDTVTTSYSDYRDVGGIRVPFHIATDQTDAAGRTDPRNHHQVQFERIAANVAIADADFAAPAMAPTAHIDNAAGVTTIPFDLVNNHIYVDGAIDGKPARFLVDTGGMNLLTPAAAKKFGLASVGKMGGTGVGTQQADVGVARGKQVRVGDAMLADPVFYVIDLGNLPQIEGVTLDGLVGYEMFRRFDVSIDYAKHALTISDPDKFVPPANATALDFKLAGTVPEIDATLDGLPVMLTVDTGSRSSLTMGSPFVREHALVAKYHAAPEAVIGWGVGGAARGRPVRFGTLQLGGLSIDGIAGELFVGDTGALSDPTVAGNLGGGVLRRFDVAFDYAKKTMYLKPNTGAGKPDEFDRSGLWLFADGDALKVVDVADGSAAQRAGMKTGDRIVAIGGLAVGTISLADWRERLRTLAAGPRLPIRFLRDGKKQTVDLVLADRIPAAYSP
ncbi:MAG: aspartyl protease family protein [Proteobacteria bacterium]|nr:aspartyl protease family protein [Pseudomonadota bacterium]